VRLLGHRGKLIPIIKTIATIPLLTLALGLHGGPAYQRVGEEDSGPRPAGAGPKNHVLHLRREVRGPGAPPLGKFLPLHSSGLPSLTYHVGVQAVLRGPVEVRAVLHRHRQPL
jgi:hypothetical protein